MDGAKQTDSLDRYLELSRGIPIDNLTHFGEGDRSVRPSEDLILPSGPLGIIQDRATSYIVTVNFYYTSDFKAVKERNMIIFGN